MFKRSFLAASICTGLLLSGCGSDGKTGPQGEAGSQGQTGGQGIPGQTAPTGLSLKVVGRFATGIYGKSAAEIVQFHQGSKSAFAINGAQNRIEIIGLAALGNDAVSDPVAVENLQSTSFNFGQTVTVTSGQGSKTINLGAANSIAIFNDTLALAVAASNKTDNGAVLFYQLDNNANATFIKAVEVGALPDMVTFTHAGDRLLVANEGEPAVNMAADPQGTISVITMTDNSPADTAATVNFTTDLRFASGLLKPEDFDTDSEQRALLQQQGVKFAGLAGTTVAQDLEPEYIAVAADDGFAYISLQENNAMAILNLSTLTVTVQGLGYKNWQDHQLDYTDKDGIPQFSSVEKLYGLYQPDTIATYQYNGATFVISANEGDSRDYVYQADEPTCVTAGNTFDDGSCIGYSEEVRVKDLAAEFTDALLDVYQQHGGKNGLGRLKVTNVLGKIDTDGDGVVDKYDALYAYGSRSFSIWDQNAHQVYDSGDDFGKISAALLGNNFNSAHTQNKGDNRSDDKGGEPEAIAVGQINDRQYAFIGLERSGDLFAYDITNPFNVNYVAHYNNRDFAVAFEMDDDLADPCDVNAGMNCQNVAVAGDLGPESIKFVPSDVSPNGANLLIIGNEVSGTVTVYQVDQL